MTLQIHRDEGRVPARRGARHGHGRGLQEVFHAAASGRPVVLDLSAVTFMDSSGLRALLQWASSDDRGPVVIQDPSPQVRRLLEITIPDGMPGLEVRPTPEREPPSPDD